MTVSIPQDGSPLWVLFSVLTLPEQLLRTLQKLGWHFRLRRPCDTLVHLGAHHVAAVKDLCPEARTHSVLPCLGAILGVAVGPVSLALAALLEQPDDRLYRGEFRADR